MFRKTIEKLKNNSGISLTELLIAMIFCLMTFALVCTAMQGSVRELKRETAQAEGKILCSTLTMSVEDKLRYAYNISGTNIENISFTYDNGSNGKAERAMLLNENGRIVLKYKDSDGSDISMVMVPDAAYTQGIKAELSKLEYTVQETNATGKNIKARFDGIVTVTDTGGKVISSQHFAVEPLNADIVED